MKILVAEDEAVSRGLLVTLLSRRGYEVSTVPDGIQAVQALANPSAPQLVLLDWVMPGLSGLEVCRWLRGQTNRPYTYVILVTAMNNKADVVSALDAGADDFVAKPYDLAELEARVRVGERVLSLEENLARKVRELEESKTHVRQLQGLIPICMHCHRIRDESSSWARLERYIEERSNAVFSHGLCEHCLETIYPEQGKDAPTVEK